MDDFVAGDLNLNGNAHTPADLMALKVRAAALMPDLPQQAQLPPDLSAGASPWLDEYVRFSKIWSPRAFDDFHISCGVWLLSTVAARRVAIDLGKRRYTNLYIALAARTSMYAKSTTAEISQAILRKCGIEYLLAPDDATPQAFIRLLTLQLPADFGKLPEMQRSIILNRLAFAGQRGWFYEEFGQKVSAMMRDGGFMADFRGLLRTFDDTPPQYEYVTIGRGTDMVYRPYVSLLANLTPADLKPYAKKGGALWGDGFWARWAFVTPPDDADRGRGRFPRYQREIPSKLTQPLTEWHQRLGIPRPDVEERLDEEGNGTGKYTVYPALDNPKLCVFGDGVYEAFYTYNDALLDIAESNPHWMDMDGNYAKLAERTLRIAMLIASLENGERIEMPHWAKAQEITEMWRANLHNLYQQVTGDAEQSKYERMEENIMRLIAKNGPQTNREIYQNVHGLDSQSSATILKAMVAAELLAAYKDGRTERYRLVG